MTKIKPPTTTCCGKFESIFGDVQFCSSTNFVYTSKCEMVACQKCFNSSEEVNIPEMFKANPEFSCYGCGLLYVTQQDFLDHWKKIEN